MCLQTQTTRLVWAEYCECVYEVYLYSFFYKWTDDLTESITEYYRARQSSTTTITTTKKHTYLPIDYDNKTDIKTHTPKPISNKPI